MSTVTKTLILGQWLNRHTKRVDPTVFEYNDWMMDENDDFIVVSEPVDVTFYEVAGVNQKFVEMASKFLDEQIKESLAVTAQLREAKKRLLALEAPND